MGQKVQTTLEQQDLDGFDPLSSTIVSPEYSKQFLEEATKREISNILKSYTGFYDLFSEAIHSTH